MHKRNLNISYDITGGGTEHLYLWESKLRVHIVSFWRSINLAWGDEFRGLKSVIMTDHVRLCFSMTAVWWVRVCSDPAVS